MELNAAGRLTAADGEKDHILVLQQNEKIQSIMQRTGCTEEQARKTLISQNWNLYNAIQRVFALENRKARK